MNKAQRKRELKEKIESLDAKRDQVRDAANQDKVKINAIKEKIAALRKEQEMLEERVNRGELKIGNYQNLIKQRKMALKAKGSSKGSSSEYPQAPVPEKKVTIAINHQQL